MEERTILFIEDDIYISDMLTKYFTGRGYKVLRAFDGDEGLLIISNHDTMAAVDAILLDLLLPGVNGFELLKKLKSDSATQHIPVIIVSNLGDQEHIDETRRLGAVNYIIKANALPRDIVTAVEEALEPPAAEL
jgi:DNA-binding response OmpR family regulator